MSASCRFKTASSRQRICHPQKVSFFCLPRAQRPSRPPPRQAARAHSKQPQRPTRELALGVDQLSWVEQRAAGVALQHNKQFTGQAGCVSSNTSTCTFSSAQADALVAGIMCRQPSPQCRHTWSPRASSYLHLGQVPVTNLRAVVYVPHEQEQEEWRHSLRRPTPKVKACKTNHRCTTDTPGAPVDNHVPCHTHSAHPPICQELPQWRLAVQLPCTAGMPRPLFPPNAHPAPHSAQCPPVCKKLPQWLAVQLLDGLLHQATPPLERAEDVLRGRRR